MRTFEGEVGLRGGQIKGQCKKEKLGGMVAKDLLFLP
jgi:hypothetical protein